MSKRLATFLTAILLVAGGGAVWLYLSASDGRASADPRNAELVGLGAKVYASQCASCHGAALQGESEWRQRLPDGSLRAPPHDQTGHTWHHPDQVLFDITKFGGQRSAPPGFTSRMPAFDAKLSDREIWAVLAYIKSRWPDRILQRQEMIDARSRQSR